MIDVAPRRGVAGLWRVDVNAGPLANHLQLIDRIGPLQIGRDKQWRVPLLLQPQSELGRQCGLTRTL